MKARFLKRFVTYRHGVFFRVRALPGDPGERLIKKMHRASIGNAVIWAAVIIAAAVLLRGTEQAGMMVVIRGGAAGTSMIIVNNALRKDGH